MDLYFFQGCLCVIECNESDWNSNSAFRFLISHAVYQNTHLDEGIESIYLTNERDSFYLFIFLLQTNIPVCCQF